MVKSVLFESRYVIDGVTMDLTPSQLLGGSQDVFSAEPVVDESLDPSVGMAELNDAGTEEYLACVKSQKRKLLFPYAGEFARSRVACALIDSIWKEGHFVLDDLKMDVSWKWRDMGLGSLAALYRSVEQLSDLSDALDVPVGEFSCDDGEPSIRIDVEVPDDRPAVGSALIPDPESWLIYVPFDTSDYRLGGSLLAQGIGLVGGQAPRMEDPDYFIDCFEVVRELVEDRVVVAGATVCDGGLMAALDQMCSKGTGADVDLSDMSRAFSGTDVNRLLFSEIPGAVIQIRDSDFDYVDAELLLQDVMYFPLGHPCVENGEVKIHSSSKTAIGSILESLIR